MRYQNKKLRHEFKYYIHPHAYEELRLRLRRNMLEDRHSVNGEGYHIRSLYFDDVFDTALYQKNSGLHTRNKYRIRIYNKSDTVIKLERKSKFGDYICKESAALYRAEYDRIVAGDIEFLKDYQEPLLREFYWELKNHGLKPRVVVDYIREAYIMDLEEVRVTFDKELMANTESLDIFDPDLITVAPDMGVRKIMEVKFNDYLPQLVKDMLNMNHHVRSAISKYVLCREESMKHFNL